MKALLSILLLTACALCVTANAFPDDTWLSEFEAVCGKADESEAMSKDELKAIISRCEKLKPLIEKSDNPQKNVYLFRLDKCRKLFIYVLEADKK